MRQLFLLAAVFIKLVATSVDHLGYVKLPFVPYEKVGNTFQRHYYEKEVDIVKLQERAQLRKRDSAIYLTNDLSITYQVEITLGGQQFSVQLDTGSADLWLYSSKNPYCKAAKSKRHQQEKRDLSQITGSATTLPSGAHSQFLPVSLAVTFTTEQMNTATIKPDIDCSSLGYFDPSKSPTYVNLNVPYHIGYADNTFAEGLGSQDTLQVGDYTLKNFTFFLIDAGNSSQYVFGIGPWSAESGSVEPYNNFPLALYKANYIKRVIYSLYLNDIDAAGGTILFGAVDTAKYLGVLQILQVNNADHLDVPVSLAVTLNHLNLLNSSNNGSENILSSDSLALLDCGTTLVTLPEDALAHLNDLVPNLYYDTATEYFLAKCENLSNYTFQFDFTGSLFDVPLSFFAQTLKLQNQLGILPDLLNKYSQYDCILNIQASADDSIILGQAFLRYFYVVYDLERYQIAMATANLNATSEQITTVTNDLPASSAPAYTLQFTTRSSGSTSTTSSHHFQSTNTKVLNGAVGIQAEHHARLGLIITIFLSVTIGICTLI